MPEIVRNVPIHNDDDYAPLANAGPIEGLEYRKNWNLNYIHGIQFRINRHLFINAELNLMFGHRGSDHRRNYTNNVGTSLRGRGAALTYSALSIGGALPKTNYDFIDFLLNISPKIGLYVPFKIDDVTFSLSSSIGYLKLMGENGWDRYDALQCYRSYNLAHVFPVAIQINSKVSYNVEISLGTQFLFLSETSLGVGSGINFQSGDRAGIGFIASIVNYIGD